MSDSKHPILIGKELRDQLEGHFDDLVKSGKVQLPPGTRMCFDLEGIPKLVDVPYPAISKQRITQILDHIVSCLNERSAEWHTLYSELEHLTNDETARAQVTHQQILEKINATQELVEEDFEYLGCQADDLNWSPNEIVEIVYRGFLPHLVSRMLGEPAGRSRDQVEGVDLMAKLERRHCGVFVLIKSIYHLQDRANANPPEKKDIAMLAAQCFETLEASLESKRPFDDKDHEVFRSLRERVDAISNGNREASPELEDNAEDETEDETEDGTEDGTEDST